MGRKRDVIILSTITINLKTERDSAFLRVEKKNITAGGKNNTSNPLFLLKSYN